MHASFLLLSLFWAYPASSYHIARPTHNEYDCAGTNYNASATHEYVCGDSRLGPAHLPTSLPFGIVQSKNFDRFGGLTPGEFLKKWYNESAKSYNYPSEDGFQLDVSESPIKGLTTLNNGTLLDRFGSERGSYLSVAGTPFSQRALPPTSLNPNSPPSNPPISYHVYLVIRPFNITAGPTAPWFGQQGFATQFYTRPNLGNVGDLIQGGYKNERSSTTTALP